MIQILFQKEKEMDVKLRELVSLGASVSAHCFPCFDYHLEHARRLGICEQEIQEAIRTGFKLMNGAGLKMLEKIRAEIPGISLQRDESCSDRQRKRNYHFAPMVRL